MKTLAVTEAAVYAMARAGLTVKEQAQRLGIKPHTVYSYHDTIKAKLGVPRGVRLRDWDGEN